MYDKVPRRAAPSGPGDGAPIALLAIVAGLAVVGSVVWALVASLL